MVITVTLEVPPSVYHLAEQTAKATARRVEEVLADVLTTTAPTTETLPPDVRAEIEALGEMSDEALWRVARSVFPRAQRRRYDELLKKNGAGALPPAEREELAHLRQASEWLMLRKAHAFALLKWRGHTLPALAELPRPR